MIQAGVDRIQFLLDCAGVVSDPPAILFDHINYALNIFKEGGICHLSGLVEHEELSFCVLQGVVVILQAFKVEGHSLYYL